MVDRPKCIWYDLLMRPTRKTLLALLMATIVAFLGWAVLQKQPGPFQPATSTPPSTPTVSPKKNLAVTVPQKALWRNYVEVSAEATPGTSCELIYVPPLGKTHQTATTADASGLCTWTWKIDETEGKGNGRLIFTIDGISETHFIEIRSAF
jgi:hypothetical protein